MIRVLMFGWEFPPHISGGLGTACHGLTKGMSMQKDIEVIFVVPKAYGDEDNGNMQIIGANTIPLKTRRASQFESNTITKYIEVSSRIVPYTQPEEYWEMVEKNREQKREMIETDVHGCIPFSGKYGGNLIQEIHNYSIVAELIAKELDFDIIHAHDWLTFKAGVAAKNASGKPLVVHVHATDFDRSRGNVNPEVYGIERYGMQNADSVITVSNLTKQIVAEKYGIETSKINTVYNAVDPNFTANDIRIDKKEGEKIVTFLGRITMQKGPEYFIEAAYRVLQRMDNVRFVMAGSGDLMNKMIHLAAKRKICDKFHFTGFLQNHQVFELLKISDLYIMPSVSEPFGISPLEAMLSEVPVIISKQSGVAEILTHAIKVDFWDINAMSDAIYGILNYPSLSSMFITHGKVEVENLKWENAAKKVREIYTNVLNNNI